MKFRKEGTTLQSPRPQSGRGEALRGAIEPLESRRLLAGHLPTQFFVFVTPQGMAGQVQAPPAVQVVEVVTVGIPASRPMPVPAPAGVQTMQPADATFTSASAPVTRLVTGGHFNGYDYQQILAEQQAADAAAQADGGDGANDPETSAPAPPTAPGGRPGKFKPGIEHGGDPDVALSAAPTPLALTPHSPLTGTGAAAPVGSVSVPTPAVVAPTPGSSPASPIRIAPPKQSVGLDTVAAVMPATAAFANIPIDAAQVAGSLAYASDKAADVLGLVASPSAQVGVVAYNFVHFNPATLLDDTIASFTSESASMVTANSATPAPARAWTITAAVIGLDVVFMGYWYQKTRRENAALRGRIRAWGLEIDPCSRRLL